MDKFLQEYVKERIISQFIDKCFLYNSERLKFVRGLSNPILTTCEGENEKELRFSLTNVVLWDKDNLIGSSYTLDGYITLVNGGNIVVYHD